MTVIDTRLADDAGLLAEVRLFAGLPPDTVRALATVARPVTIEAGDVLFTQGEHGESAYVVRSGRLDVLIDGVVVEVLGRASAFGELALLTGGPRRATVRARRDAELLTVDRFDFDRLLSSEPAFAAAVARQLAQWLPAGQTARTAAPSSTVLALLPLHAAVSRAAVARLSRLLTAELHAVERAVLLDGTADPTRWAGDLEAAEATTDVVLLVADRPDGAWPRFCRRQADRVLGLADPSRGGPTGTLPPGGQLVVLGPAGTGRWLDHLTPVAHHVIDLAAPGPDVARLARRIRGRALGLVLSGGGARGLAHVGVIEEFQRAGVVIDRVGGTSMGAVVAGMLALGTGAPEMLDVARRELVTARPFADYTWPRHSLIRGARVDATLSRVFGDARMEDQRCGMFAVSVDLLAAEAVAHRTGPIADAVALSIRLPGILPPRRVGPALHVDGGVLDNLPIGVMVADGEGPVIAVDVAQPFASVRGAYERLPGIVDIIARSITLAGWRRTDPQRGQADTVITPQLGDIGILDFRRIDEIVEGGRRAARAALGAGVPRPPGPIPGNIVRPQEQR